MVNKILFPVELNESNKYKKNYLIKKLNKYLNLPQSTLLEIGIGNGRFGFLLGQEVSHYYGIDPDAEYVEIAKTNIPKNAKVTYKTGSAENIPFTQKFDIIFYAQSWHFIKNFQKALDEAKRVLAPAGIIVILDPSEKTTSWASPKLRKNSPEFDESEYKKKLRDLERGKKEILNQSIFNLIEREYDPNTTLNLFILQN